MSRPHLVVFQSGPLLPRQWRPRYVLNCSYQALIWKRLESDYILNINNESYNRSIISVSATTGRVEEYQLILSATISASKKDENTIINNETITITRDYAYDESAVLGNDNEETIIKEDMARQAASRIIRRLNAASR